MSMRIGERRVGFLTGLLASAALAAGLFGAAPAEARHRHGGFHRAAHVRHVFHVRHSGRHHVARAREQARHARSVGTGGFLRPTYASIIVDANTGRTLSAENENTPHHPASVTKVMTLYLLFEQLEKGRLTLESDLTISPHAAAQSPSKLGLRPGSTIEVEDAIKAVVTKSANDIAVAIAENIGGDEPTFAEMMTQRARSLGMNGTTYRNASGLPNPQQITTARDLSILGRAIQDRFPRYYKYFSTRTFYFAGRPIANHNHLLGRVDGMDGIKTGYTAASGFNLLTSVRRDGRHIVGVVLGGRSGPQRDNIMARLIEDNLMDGSARRTAVAIAERETEPARESARVMESAPDEAEAPAPKSARIVPAIAAASQPRIEAKKPEERRVTVASLDLSVPTAPIKAEVRTERARPAVVTATRQEPQSTESIGRVARRTVADGSTTRALPYAPTATPSSLRWMEGAQGHPRPVARTEAPKSATGRTEVAKVESKVQDTKSSETKAADRIALVRPAHTGWMIQIGATEDAEKANSLLARAKAKAPLASARPFTEKVQKGGGTLWRARFAGLEEDSAEAACRTLKRSGFSCFATKN